MLSVSVVGSLRELPPGSLVLVDQFIDRTVEEDEHFSERALWPCSLCEEDVLHSRRCCGGRPEGL